MTISAVLRLPPLLLLLLVLGGCGGDEGPASDIAAPVAVVPQPVEEAPGVDAPAPAAAADAAPQRVPAQVAERVRLLRERRRAQKEWWSDPSIAGNIGLDDDQRAAIEARVAEQASRRERTQADVRAARQDFRAAIGAGELERAREAARREAALVSELQLAQRLLLVEVLATLDDQQRSTMLAEHPGVLTAMASAAEDGRRGQRGGRPRARAAEGD